MKAAQSDVSFGRTILEGLESGGKGPGGVEETCVKLCSVPDER